jgi:hypothetical protein
MENRSLGGVHDGWLYRYLEIEVLLSGWLCGMFDWRRWSEETGLLL